MACHALPGYMQYALQKEAHGAKISHGNSIGSWCYFLPYLSRCAWLPSDSWDSPLPSSLQHKPGISVAAG
jgi:hypothetical protein